MSSDYISSVPNFDAVRMQGTQAVGRAPEARESGKIEQAERNKMAAANGQDMPLERTEDAADVEKVETAVSQISDFVQNLQRDLLFSIDEDSEQLVVKVVDSQTQEVIRQIPSEETLRIARHLGASESLILHEQA